MKRINSLLILLFSFLVSFAQTESYPGLAKDASKEKKLLDAITTRLTKDVSGLSGGNKKYIAEIYKERYELIRTRFSENEIITDQNVSSYLLALTNEIAKGNPLINPVDLQVMFSKTWWPNASSMGEGTIFFNIGLFHRLQNESQAVFVLCHELAHYYLDHSNINIQRYVNLIYSDEFQNQLKSIQKSAYRKNQQIESLAKNLSFRSRRHTREFEQAADSMAIELMKNTNYDLNEALSWLALLDSVDKDKYNNKLELSSRFDFSSFHFKKTWTQSDLLLFAIEKDEKKSNAEDDSLKTHPDCKTRIEKIAGSVKKYNKPSNRKFIVSKDDFQRLKNQFDFEILEYCFANNKVSRCLYFALEMLHSFPESAYLHTLVGKCLNEIYARQKAHELGKIVDLPGPDFEEEYNKLLHMIQNLRLQEIAALSYYYLQQYQFANEKNKEFATVWQTSKENFTR